jgi:hypothetical protein
MQAFPFPFNLHAMAIFKFQVYIYTRFDKVWCSMQVGLGMQQHNFLCV